jgi:hypothetical protein
VITDEEIDVFLEHHGVKGQRWGVRKSTVVGALSAGVIFAGMKFTLESNTFMPASMATVISSSAAAVGGILVHNLLEKHGQKKLDSSPKPMKP